MFEWLNPSKSSIVSNSFIYFTIIRRAILFSLELIPSSPPHPPPPPLLILLIFLILLHLLLL